MEEGRESDVQQLGSLLGEPVTNPAGEELGSIEELMIDAQDGIIAYAVLSFSDPYERHDRLYAVPWRSMRHDMESGRFILEADRDKLAAAPAFERGSWPKMGDRGWAEEIHQYYGQVPYWQHSYYADRPAGPTQMGGHKKPSPFH
jgi:sporulation protein YlmC with PRC-barrel domain